MVTSRIRPSAQRFSAEDRRQQILAAATELFARQGFQGTTTRQIAQHAQINEAIIFRHFSSKEDLYWAVIEDKCKEGESRDLVAEFVAKDLPVEEVFIGIAREFLRLRQQDFTLGRLLLFSALEQHQLSERFFRTHVTEIYESLARYIRQQIDAGTFRDVDALIAARGFWGMVVYHFLVQELFGGKEYQDIDADEASRKLVDVWLQGMLPEGRRQQAERNNNKLPA